jgi:hypothetical protein
MVDLWWQWATLMPSTGRWALRRRLPGAPCRAAAAFAACSVARTITNLTTLTILTTLLLVVAASGASAQQPAPGLAASPANTQTEGSIGNHDTAPDKKLPKTGNHPGALRQQADQRFLARRGIDWHSQVHRPGATITPAEALRLARYQHQALLRQAAITPDASTTPGTWQSIGPAQVATSAYGAVTGRITSLAADPHSSGNTLYLGSTGGGVWKSTNAAGTLASVTFVPLTDDLPAFSNTLGSLSIGALTVQPASSSVILAGTGDINDALDSYYGVGILRSTDGGNTWTLIGGSKDEAFNGGLENYSFSGNGFAGFAWSSTNTNLVVAAVAQSVEGILVNANAGQSVEAGLYYSKDAGQTWFLGIIEDDSTHIVQSPNVAGSPPGNSVTSVVWNPVRQRFYAAVRFHGYYESLDGITWTRLANQPGAGLSASACPTNGGTTGQTSCPIFRGALAVQPVTGDMFALTTDDSDLDQGLFHDVCSTNGLAVTQCASSTVAFGTQIASGALENGSADPDLPATTIVLADYNLTLAAVSSQQDTILFAGTEDIFRCSLANSCAWRNTTNINDCAAAQVAPSQHATESTFGSTGLVYFANDGGLWRSTDTVGQTGAVCASTDASHFQNLNGGIGSLAEIEHFTVSPANQNVLLAGMGGFGTVSTTTGQGEWQQLLTGEGSYTAIDPANTQNWYTEAGGGVDILRCTAGTNCNAAGFGTPVVGSVQVEDDADYFEEAAPWLLDPLNTANLLVGTCRVWRGPATGGSGWSSSNVLSPMLDGNQQPFCNGNAELRSIGAGLDASAPAGSEQIYAGIAGPYDGGGTTPGHVFGSIVPASGGQTTWTDLYHSPVTNTTNTTQFNQAGFAISSIAVDPHDATGQTVYVTTQGFSSFGVSAGEVYGSTTGGASWLNLTNSLPLAPANSIVVDPNVPSILYVALDTGVYYTQNVANCANQAQTCWAVYGSGLPNAPITSLQIYSAGSSSVLQAATYGRGIWALALLTSPSVGTLTPSSATFPSRQLATTSPATAFTLANTGGNAISITAIQADGDYAQTNNCGSSLAVSASCSIQVTFTPTVAGDRPGTLTVYANVSGGHLASTLDGTGITPGLLTITPSTLSYPATVQGSTSAAQTVSIQNTGGAAVQLQTLTVTTDYQLSSNTCGATLAPGSTCSAAIVFTPSALGDRPGHLSIPSNLAGSPALVPLDGTGVTSAILSFTPLSLAFPSTAQGSVSAPQSITVTNTGGATAVLQNVTLGGDYQIVSNSCGSTLAPNATCVIQIAFAPVATGNLAGLLSITANVPGGDQTGALSGTGLAPAALTLSPASLTFPATTQGVASSALSIRLTSSGGVAVQLQTPTVTGDYAVSASTCTSTLAPAATCTLQITFTPTATGDRPGLLTVPGNAPSTAPLDGTGISPPSLTLTPTSLTFTTTAVGATSAAQGIVVANVGGTTAQLLSPATTGDFAVSSNNCGAALAPSASCTVMVTFSPSTTGSGTGTLTISGTNVPPVAPAALSGNAVTAPVVTFNPSPANFGSPVPVGSASAPQTITATNTGTIPVTLQLPTIAGDFQIYGTTCTSTLAAGDSCTIDVVFHPSQVGSLAGSLALSGTMSGGQVTDSLSGAALPAQVLTLTPGVLNYGTIVGSPAAAQTVTVSNTGGLPLDLPPATLSGNDAGDYAFSSNCPSTLAAGDSCTIEVTFLPAAAGLRPAALQQSDGLTGDQYEIVSLNGIGLRPGSVAFSPVTMNFGAVVEGTNSSAATFTATNSGGLTVNLQPASITGDYAIGNNTCGATLAPNAVCTLAVTFTPTASGGRTGMLALPSDASNSPATVSLSGSGVTPATVTLGPSTLSFPVTVVGATSAKQVLTATNAGGVTAQLQAPAASSNYQVVPAGTTCQGTLAAGASCALQVAFAPTSTGDQPGTLTLPGTFTGSPDVSSLDGQGVAPGALTLTPASLSFSSVVTGASSSPLPIVLTNPGGQSVTLGAISVLGDYSIQSNNCPASLAPQASCTLQIVFSPGASGDREGLLIVPGNIAGVRSTAKLDGNGVLPGSLSVSSSLLSFGSIVVGATSAPQSLTLTNSGGSYIDLQAPSVSSAQYQVVSNNCTSILDIGKSCTLGIVFAPTLPGDQPATLTVSGGGGAIQAHTALDGSGIGPALLVFAPTTLSFGSVLQGKTSAQQAATLTNSGGMSALLQAPVIVGDFAIASNSCTTTLAAAASCTLQLTFSPSAAGARSGSVTYSTTDKSSSASVSLTGTETPPPALVLTPTALVFLATAQGVTTAAQNITVANTGTTPLTTQAPVITGDFAISADTCTGTTLNPQFSCTLSITFTPTAGGQRSGLLTVSDTTETHTATLNGTGLTAPTDTLSATSLTFGPQVFGTVSPAQSVSVTNSGGSTLNSISVTASGPFNATDNCGTLLGGGLTCSIAVTFAPIGAGVQTGQLVITDALRSQIVTLNGDGVLPPQAVATPASLDFGPYAVNIASPVQLVTLTNNGLTPLSGVTAVTGTASFAVATNGCATTVAAGASCTLGISFTPQQIGNAVDQLTISSPSLTGTLSVALSGSGEDFQLSVTGTSSVLVTNGQTATYQFALTPVGSSAGTVTMTCSGVPSSTSCTPNPASLSVSGGTAGSITVSIATGVTTTGSNRPPWTLTTALGSALALLLPCLFLRGRARRTFLALLVTLALVFAPSACGVHASGGSTTGTGRTTKVGTTPPGEYSIVIIASFPGAQRTATVTLTVE